ncbi:DUF4062 domain-containing protein [Agrobacterium tumefaciens]|uniref:DUF4062 domain-containing protein n=1 Tax=Agrobacterium tumefaciens TaxID=358 RepID=UPI001574B612|nr:DUF4062 domain-containing protein [Agrobacterium tumefaciens]NTE66657.1 DUF4062 domain-containing protein [Agrobacterium tumefaciens]
MAGTPRYQVFLSSTFTDLKEERAEVIQALWELDCIPTGMEAFLASNISQWDVIQRVIDECDYYILIIGGRYGSVTDEGISYTEKEYDYAKKIGLPILAFVHASPEDIPSGKTDLSEPLREKLNAFRTKVMTAHPVRRWSIPHELGGLASRSLIQEIKRNPRPGWIRNDGESPVELLKRIDALTQENIDLKARVKESLGPSIPIDELASGKDTTVLSGTIKVSEKDPFARTRYRWEAEVTWDEIFRNIGPFLINEADDQTIENELSEFYRKMKADFSKYRVHDHDIYSSSYNDVIVQLRALGLIQIGQKKRGVNDKGNYWALTDAGDRYLVSLRARRKDGTTVMKLHDEDEKHSDEAVADLNI